LTSEERFEAKTEGDDIDTPEDGLEELGEELGFGWGKRRHFRR
jgi:hypothetical protein